MVRKSPVEREPSAPFESVWNGINIARERHLLCHAIRIRWRINRWPKYAPLNQWKWLKSGPILQLDAESVFVSSKLGHLNIKNVRKADGSCDTEWKQSRFLFSNMSPLNPRTSCLASEWTVSGPKTTYWSSGAARIKFWACLASADRAGTWTDETSPATDRLFSVPQTAK